MANEEKFQHSDEVEREKTDESDLNEAWASKDIIDDIESGLAEIRLEYDTSGKIVGRRVVDENGNTVSFEDTTKSLEPKFDSLYNKTHEERKIENRKINELMDRMVRVGAVQLEIKRDKSGKVIQEKLVDAKGNIFYFDDLEFLKTNLL